MRLTKIDIISAFCGAALLLGACGGQKEEGEKITPAPTDPNEVRFDVSSVVNRSNAILNVESVLSMGIFGYSTGTDDFSAANPAHTPNLIYNQAASRTTSGDPWTYSPKAYWPMDLSVKNSFFAYSPHSSQFDDEAQIMMSASSASGYPTMRYTMPEDISKQQDILWAAPVLNRNRNSVDTLANNGKISYRMEHTLAWIAFVVVPTASLAPDTETFTVEWFSFMAESFPTRAVLDLGTGKWTNPVYSKVVYDFELNDAAKGIRPNQPARIINANNRLMVFPFEIDSETTKATVDLTFTYDPGNGSQTGDPEEFYYYMPFPSARMAAGRVIVYVINISVDGISVHFLEDNKIEDWIQAEEEGREIEIY